MFRTRQIRNLFARPFTLGQRRRQKVKPRNPVKLRLESLEDRVVPDATSCVAGNVVVNYYGASQSPQFTLPVTVNDNAGGTVTSGTVTINLVNGNNTITLGSGTVSSNGSCDVDVDLGTLPANLSIGNYELVENYSGSGNFDACSANGTLTISALSTTVVSATVSFSYSKPTTVTESGGVSIPIGADASNYVVLYEGEGGHTLHITNSTINGNVGIGNTGVLHIDGHADIDGTCDFAGSAQFQGSPDQDGDDSDNNGNGNGNGNGHGKKDNDDDEGQESAGPVSFNANDAAVTSALNAVNALSASFAGLGTSIQINGSGTINESDGQLVTLNGVSYRVFNVSSYHMGDNDVLTIKGDGSGIPVVFDFDGNGTINLSGDVDLDNGLTASQVLWNVTGSGGQVHLHGNDSDRPCAAFQGIILAPNDTIDLANANLIGRVFGGDDTDMQIVGQNHINAPPAITPVTVTTSGNFTVAVDVACANGPVTSGTVAFDIVAGNQIIQLGTATVGSNGIATLTVTDQATLQKLASLMPGNYVLDVTYSGGDDFSGCGCTTTVTINPEPTTINVSPTVNVTINNNTTYNITVNVNSPNGPVSSGTVTIDLVNGNQTIPLGTATIGPNGTVTVTLNGTTLSSLPSGQYQLVINFSPASGTPNGSGSTTTTMNLLPQTQPNVTTTTGIPTSLLPGNGVSNFNGGPGTIPVVVNSLLGPVPEGTVTITLLTPTGSVVIGSGPISGGAASVPVTVPAGLLPGNYPMLESFTDNGTYLGSNSTGNLSILPLNPLVAALELALDAAMLANANNPGSVGELEMFSQVFLHQPISTLLPQLLSNIQSLLPQTGSELFPALSFASFLDTDLPIENPM